MPSAPGAPKVEGTSAAPNRSPEVVAWSLFGLLVLFFLVLKSYSLHWETGDENIYFYMAWATIDHGALPYADYFFAHPPLHLLPGILVFALLGFNPLTARLVPVGAALTGAVFLFLLAKDKLGRVAAVATVFLYLTSFSLLRASSHWTGINLSVMWSVVGLWALWGKRPITAGVCLALGVGTGNYVLPGAMMLGLLAGLRSKRDGLRYLMGFAAPWAVIQLAGMILGGGGYLDAVYRYHVQKPEAAGAAWKMSVREFTDNFALFLGTLLGPLLAALDRRLLLQEGVASPEPRGAKAEASSGMAWLWRWFQRRLLDDDAPGLARVGALWALGYIIFIAMLPRVFPFYFLLAFPGMALAGGYAVERMIHHGLALSRGYRRRSRTWWEAVGILAALLVAVLLGHLVRIPIQRGILPDYVRRHDKPMKWSDSPLPFNRLLRWCCWNDVARAYTDYGTVPEILYHESQYFEKAGELADYLKAHSQPDQTLFGDASTAGIVALLSGRRLASDFADTNTMRFASGITSVVQAIRQIDTPRLAFVLASGSIYKARGGKLAVALGKFAHLPGFRKWLEGSFEISFKVRDRTKGWFFLLGRTKPGPPRPPPI